MKYDYLFTATGDIDREGVISALLKYANMDNVKIQSHISFESFLESLPDVPIPGLAAVCHNWLNTWGNTIVLPAQVQWKDVCDTNDARKLAQKIYNCIAGHIKMPFEASSIVMAAVSAAIRETQKSDPEDDSMDTQ